MINSKETLLSLFVSDFDLTSAYSSKTIAFNISRETKLFSVYDIEGHTKSDIFDFFSCFMTKKENVVYLGKKYFNLPSYTEMEDIFKKEIK